MAEACQESQVKSQSMFERAREGIHHAKEEIGAVLHKDHSKNHHEPQSNLEVEVKSQSLLDQAKEKIDQAKEEIGAVLHRDHSENHHQPQPNLGVRAKPILASTLQPLMPNSKPQPTQPTTTTQPKTPRSTSRGSNRGRSHARARAGPLRQRRSSLEAELKSQSLLDRAKEKIDQAKEEIGAVLHRDNDDDHSHSHHIHHHHEPESKLGSLVSDLHIHHEPESKLEYLASDSEDAVKKLFERTKKELEEIMDDHKPDHHKNIFERAKKEMEELAHSIHQKKREHHFKHEVEGCMSHIGSWFENMCAPRTCKRD